MKTYLAIIVLFLLVTRVIAGEIPDDFLQTDRPLWKAYFNTYLVFPQSRITLKSFWQCVLYGHLVIQNKPDPDHDPDQYMISLSAVKLHPRQALWELKQQTGCDITAVEDNTGTLLIKFPKKDTTQ